MAKNIKIINLICILSFYIKEAINLALKTLFNQLRQENAKSGFGNIIAVANEAALIRDFVLEEMEKTDYDDIDLNSPDAEDDFKNQAIDDEEMDKLIEKIPESDIDEASVDAARLSNENSPVDPDDYIGAPLESVMYDIDALIPETEEF